MISIIFWKKLKINRFFTFFFIFFLLFGFLSAQDTLLVTPLSVNKAIVIDSSSLDSIKIKLPPNPKKSALYSLVLPGSGQIYNGNWWKTPFVYAAIGGSIAYLQFNQSRYKRFKTALELELAKKPHEFTGKINSAEALRNLRNKNTQTSYIGVVVVYGIVAIEAFVDAHLQNFDISDDLSIKVKMPGLQFVYTF
jgi:hypothetical protein